MEKPRAILPREENQLEKAEALGDPLGRLGVGPQVSLSGSLFHLPQGPRERMVGVRGEGRHLGKPSGHS